MSSHRVVLCADDFGLTEGVSRGILELAERGRLSATSVMTNCAAWPGLAPALRAFDGRIGVGLHLNLTTGAPLGPMPGLAPGGVLPNHPELLMKTLTGRIDRGEIGREIERQLDAFAEGFGRAPDFIDGHQHVHVLPGIRGALLSVLAERGLCGALWLRDPSDTAQAIVRRRLSAGKALIVGGLASGFRSAAAKAGCATNRGFSGFSPFDPALPAERVFESAFRDLGPRPVVMCHPGHVDEPLRRIDPVAEPREQELAYLTSDRFPELLARADAVLVPRPE